MAIKSLEEYINEASINAKKRNIKFAKKMFTKGGKNGGVGCFAIITAENPDSKETDRKTNKRLLDSLKKDLKNAHYTSVSVEGQYGNREHSILVFNIQKDAAARYAGKYQQTSFFWCSAGEKSPECEYWEKADKDRPYHPKKNPYELINTTNIIHNADGAEDFYTVIGGDYKFNIDDSVFSRVSEAIEESIDAIVKSDSKRFKDIETVLEWAYNEVGYGARALRKNIAENIESRIDLG